MPAPAQFDREYTYTLDYKMIEVSEIQQYKTVFDAEQVIQDLKYFIDKRR